MEKNHVCNLVQVFISAVSENTSERTVWILVDVYLAYVVASLIAHFDEPRSLVAILLHPVKSKRLFGLVDQFLRLFSFNMTLDQPLESDVLEPKLF